MQNQQKAIESFCVLAPAKPQSDTCSQYDAHEKHFKLAKINQTKKLSKFRPKNFLDFFQILRLQSPLNVNGFNFKEIIMTAIRVVYFYLLKAHLEKKKTCWTKKQHLLMSHMLDLKDNNDLCKNHLSSWKKRQNMTQKVFMYIFSTLMIMTQYSTAATMM